MKTMRKILFAFTMLIATTFVATSSTRAQSNQGTNVGQLVSGLINVDIGAVAVNIGDITVADLVNVGDVLSNNRDIRILDNILNHNPVLNNNSQVLTNLLRNANILTDTQVVVGVLSGGAFAIQNIP
jgi:hypothetical protein